MHCLVDNVVDLATATPDALAVSTPHSRLTRGDLLASAEDLAARLRERGVGPETIVGLSTVRGHGPSVGMLAVWLLGAAWVPLDPTMPRRRLELTLTDLDVDLVIGVDDDHAGLGVVLEPPRIVSWADRGAPLMRTRPHPEALAYVIHTSGSTGRPKPVGVTYAALDHLAEHKVRRYAVGPASRVLQFAPVSFDVAVAETVMALSGGAVLVTCPPEVLTPGPAAVDWLRAEAVTHLLISPSALAAMPAADLPDLTVLGLGGEVVTASLARRWAAAGRRIVNGYGPTEVTVWATCHDVDPGAGEDPAIGWPFPGVTTTLLAADTSSTDTSPTDTSPGGELAVGGAGLARGYLGCPGLTAERFVPDPDGPPGSRRYRTGDAVTRDANGLLWFVGRLDDQVKIRGFRVEPAEISCALRTHPGVDDAVTVVDRSTPQPRLVAYVTGSATSATLTAHLADLLPRYALPTAVVTLPSLPLTPHGKVDTGRLPAPERTDTAVGSIPTAPRSDLERDLLHIFVDLLGMPGLGVDDDFFAVGGHSLLVARLVLRVNEELGATVSLGDVLARPTVAALAALMTAGDSGDSAPRMPAITPRDPAEVVPLTHQQERVWFLERLSPGNLAYNTQASLRIRGPLDVELLRDVLATVVGRHEVLRTRFVLEEGRPVQDVLGEDEVFVELPVTEVDEDGAADMIARAVAHRFDLSRPPLARWHVLRHGPEDHTLVQVEHHFVHDGWSFALLMREVVELYAAHVEDREACLPTPLQYGDYAVVQRAWMSGDVLERHVAAWRAMLAGAPPVLTLPTDRPRPRQQSFRGDLLRVILTPELVRALDAYARARGRSLFATMLAGFCVLLERYSGERDLLVGTGSANRHTAALEGMLGMVVNTLVLRVRCDPHLTFDELVDRAAGAVAAAYTWPDVPTDEVVRAMDPPRDASRNPLFQVMFSFHDSPVPDLHLGEAAVELTERHNGSAKSDLNVVVVPRASQRRGRSGAPEDERMTLLWEFATDLFDISTMRRMVDRYLHLLAVACADPSTRVGRLALEPPPTPSDGSDAPVSADAVGRVEAVATQTPSRTAIVDGATTWTYADLWLRSARLARRLQAAGVGVEDIVGVHLPRSAELVCAQLAILRCGATYFPLDPALPAARIDTLVADAAPLVVLSDSWSAPATGVPPLVMDPADEAVDDPHADGASVALTLPVPSEARAYVLFTSGSTGAPKGVELTRGNLATVAEWHRELVGSSAGTRVSQIAAPGFDASVMEVWGTLVAGATLVIVPCAVRSHPDRLRKWLCDNDIEVAFLPTALAEWVVDAAWPWPCPLRVLQVGGDALRRPPVRQQPWSLVNSYGPTETTVIATSGVVHPDDHVPTLGPALPGARCRVLRDGQPQPSGVPGELVVGGPGVGRGYLGRPGATAAAFVPDPEGPPGSRRYLTGDHAWQAPDGRFVFAGRRDRQTKIRGVRVELGEVTAALAAQPGVVDAAATVRMGAGGARLVGYVVGDVDPATVRQAVAVLLPAAAVPAVVLTLGGLPLTPNGKLDEAALPDPPVASAAAAGPASGVPCTPDNRVAHDAWTETLGAAPASEGSDFFAAGGHSLLAIRLVALVHERTSADIDLAELFADPTFGGLCRLVEAAQARPSAASPEAVERTRAAAAEVDIAELSDAELADLATLLSGEGAP